MLGRDPQRAKVSATDGVLQLQAGEVRQVRVVRIDKEPGQQAVETVLEVDVLPDPLTGRASHALIKFHPIAGGGSNFNKLKERLAKLATWAPEAEISTCT